MYKYVFKGHDLIEISAREVRNEIEDYSNSRYVSSMEAAYRILGYPMHGESHSIIRLEVHLENANASPSIQLKIEVKYRGVCTKRANWKLFLSSIASTPMRDLLFITTFQNITFGTVKPLLGSDAQPIPRKRFWEEC